MGKRSALYEKIPCHGADVRKFSRSNESESEILVLKLLELEVFFKEFVPFLLFWPFVVV